MGAYEDWQAENERRSAAMVNSMSQMGGAGSSAENRQTAVTPTTADLEAFAADYRALCEKHGLRLVYDGGYTPHQAMALDADDAEPSAWTVRPIDEL